MENMEKEANHLAALFKKHDITNRAEFARTYGIRGGGAMIYQHINGLKPISLEAGKAYARGFNCSLKEISARLAKMVDLGETEQPERKPIEIGENSEYAAIKRVRFKLSAGISGFEIEYLNGHRAPIFFRRDWILSRNLNPDALFAVEINGASMEPSLFDGDIVVVNTDDTTPKDGEPFAANYEGELVVKRLVRNAGVWSLSSDNPDKRRFPDKVCDERTILIGRVIYKQSERI